MSQISEMISCFSLGQKSGEVMKALQVCCGGFTVGYRLKTAYCVISVGVLFVVQL